MLSGYLSSWFNTLGAVPPSPVLPHPYSENSCDSFFRPVDLHGNRPLHAASAKRPEVGLGHLDRSVLDETKRILETKTRRNPTRKSVPPRARKRTKSGRVREGQNSRIRRVNPEILSWPSRGSAQIKTNPTYEHIKVEILNGPLDTSKSKF